MDGKLGVLNQCGKQVGGIYDWEVNLSYDSAVKHGWQEVRVVKHILAQSYWLVEIPIGNTYGIELYQEVEGQLVIMDEGNVSIDLPDIETLDQRLYAPLELIWRQPGEY